MSPPSSVPTAGPITEPNCIVAVARARCVAATFRDNRLSALG